MLVPNSIEIQKSLGRTCVVRVIEQRDHTYTGLQICVALKLNIVHVEIHVCRAACGVEHNYSAAAAGAGRARIIHCANTHF